MTGNDADALDATQEALIAIVRGLPRFDGRAAFSTWAYRVATNACLDELRRAGATVARPEPGPTPRGRALARRAATPGPTSVADRLAIDDGASPRCPRTSGRPSCSATSCGLDYAEIAEVLGTSRPVPSGRASPGAAAAWPTLARTRSPPSVVTDDEHRGPTPGTPTERRRPSTAP